MAFPDSFPVSEGHHLIVPRRHERDVFALEDAEMHAVLELLIAVRKHLVTERSPDAFNVGVNAGLAAGQTVDHAHLHVIPRYDDDVPDPRGGVRWVLPERAAYWNE